MARQFRSSYSASDLKDAPRWVWWVATGLALTFVLVGVGFAIDAVMFRSAAIGTTGEVIDVELVRSYDRERRTESITYRPTIRYTDTTGTARTGTTHISSSGYDYAIGAPVDILYDPADTADTADVRIDSIWSLYLMPFIFITNGSVFLIVILFVRRKFASAGLVQVQSSPTVRRR